MDALTFSRAMSQVRRRPLLILCLTTLTLAMPAFAQVPDSTKLPRVAITATRVQTRLGSAIPSVTVLDARALERAGVRDVAEALRTVPGVVIARSGGPGAQTSIFLRGGESDFVRILVDGVPMNDPGGAVDLASYTLDQVDRIEIVRGSGSVLYGTDAVAGVIQVLTRGSNRPIEAEALVSAGGYGTRNGKISLGFSNGRVSAGAGFGTHRSDGIHPFNNQNANDVLNARVVVRGSEGSRLSLTGRQQRDEFHYPTDGAGKVVDRNAFRTDRRTIISMDAEQRLGTRARVALTLAALNGKGRTDDSADDSGDTLGFHTYGSIGGVRRRTADLRLSVEPAPATLLTLGLERTTESQSSRDSSNFSPEPNVFSAMRQNTAAYAQLLTERGRFQLTVGGRYDDNEVFGSFGTARVGAAARLWDGASLRGSVGSAFKAPTFLEQFNTAFTIGNRGLRPERSRSYEVGVSQTLGSGRAYLAATWFDQRFHDLVQYTYVDPNTSNYFNVAAASSRGLELEARTQLIDKLRLEGNVTLLRTRVVDAGFDTGMEANFVAGNRLLRRPSRSASLTLLADPLPRLSVASTVIGVGDRDDRDFSGFPATPVVLPAYVRVDVSAQIRLVDGSRRPAVSALLRADNLFGRRYQEVAGFAVPGRLVIVGMRLGANSGSAPRHGPPA